MRLGPLHLLFYFETAHGFNLHGDEVAKLETLPGVENFVSVAADNGYMTLPHGSNFKLLKELGNPNCDRTGMLNLFNRAGLNLEVE